MLKIKWNLIPKEFTTGNYLASGKLRVNSPYGYERVLIDSEHEKISIKDRGTPVQSREDWEREQWKSAPEWARYHAVDSDGGVYWFYELPHLKDYKGGHICWSVPLDAERERTTVVFQYGEDWKRSLRKRPEPVNAEKPVFEGMAKEVICLLEESSKITDQYRQDVIHVAAIFKASNLNGCKFDMAHAARAVNFIAEVDRFLAERKDTE